MHRSRQHSGRIALAFNFDKLISHDTGLGSLSQMTGNR